MKVKYIGDNPTRVKVAEDREKIDLEKGDVFEVSGKYAKAVLGAYKSIFKRVDEEVEDVPEKKAEVETQEAKTVKKTTPKKRKRSKKS